MNAIEKLFPVSQQERSFQLKVRRDAGTAAPGWVQPQFVECKKCGRRATRQRAEDGAADGVAAAGAADAVELKVYDKHGTLVATKSWGESKAGALDYELPTLPAGEYSFEVKASLAGVTTTSKNYVASRVERVSLPGTGEAPVAPVFEDGLKTVTLRGENLVEEFIAIVGQCVWY